MTTVRKCISSHAVLGVGQRGDRIMGGENGLSRYVKQSSIDPVLQAYEPGEAFEGHFPSMIYKVGEKRFGYYDNIPIREDILLFLMLSLFLYQETE